MSFRKIAPAKSAHKGPQGPGKRKGCEPAHKHGGPQGKKPQRRPVGAKR